MKANTLAIYVMVEGQHHKKQLIFQQEKSHTFPKFKKPSN